MKQYNIEIQRNMRMTVQVVADNLEQAKQSAMAISKQTGIAEFRSWGDRVNSDWSTTITAKEAARMKRQAVMDYCRHYLHDGCDKEELAAIAFRGETPNWQDYRQDSHQPWLDTFFERISEGTDPKSHLYHRYLRLAARLRFHSYYRHYDGFDRDLTGTSKEQKKQAVRDMMDELTRRFNEADRNDDCRLDFQATLRYPDATNPENDYWNVFVYPLCNGGFEYCWQHCMDESNDIDDYGTITCDTPEALLKALFYRQDCDTTDGDPDCTALEHIWVD
jgi:hypothetical protein